MRAAATSIRHIDAQAPGLSVAVRATAAFGAAVCIAWLIAHGGSRHAAAVLALVPLAAFVLRRRENGVLLGTALIILIPWWMTFGSSQLKVSVLASLLALSGTIAALTLSRRRPQRLNFIDVSLAAFLTAAAVSFIFSGPYTYHSLTAFLLFTFPFSFYIGARELGGRAARSICWALLLAGTVASFPLFYEFLITRRPLFQNGNIYYWSVDPGGLFRPGGTFGGPPQAVTALSMTTLAGLSLLVTSSGGRRWIISACVAVSLAGMILTFTRAGLIGFGLGVIVFLAFWRPAALGRLAYAIATLGLVFFFAVLPGLVGKSWYQQGVIRHGTFADREVRWRAAWPLITNSPEHAVAGHGINSLFVGHPTGLTGQPQADLAAVPILIAVSPHSQYIRTLLEQGFIGLTLLLAWLLGSVAKALRGARSLSRDYDRALLAGSAAGIVSLMIVSLAGDALRDPVSLAIVALLSGMVAGRFENATTRVRARDPWRQDLERQTSKSSAPFDSFDGASRD